MEYYIDLMLFYFVEVHITGRPYGRNVKYDVMVTYIWYDLNSFYWIKC